MFRLRSCALRLGEQDAVGHQLDEGIRRAAVAEANLVTDQAPRFALQFLRKARRRGTRRDAPRLGVADQAGRAAPQCEADLGNLRRFARAGFAADDHHRMSGDQRGDLVAPRIDRQIVGKLRLRQARPAGCHQRARPFEQALALGLQRRALAAEQVAQVTRQRTQATPIAGQAVGEGVGGCAKRPGRGGNGRRAHRDTGNRRSWSRLRAVQARRECDDSKLDDIGPMRAQSSTSSGLRTPRPPRLSTCV